MDPFDSDLETELAEIISSAWIDPTDSDYYADDVDADDDDDDDDDEILSMYEMRQFVTLALCPSVSAIQWNDGQRQAIDRIADWRHDYDSSRFFSLTGPAGVGKTSVMQAVRSRLFGTRTAWSAMTGKAASRMKEASGVNAKTLHSVLYHPPREIDNPAERKIDLEFDKIKAGEGSCLLVIDEASMIGTRIREDIERSSYDKILFVGDPYQIPPVLSKIEEKEQGGDYSVFSDVDGVCLVEVMRAAGAVLHAATYVRERQQIPLENEMDDKGGSYQYTSADRPDVALGIALACWFEDRDDHALITWRNETRMTTNRIIRLKLGYKNPLPEPGEPVVIRRNVYDSDVNLMNGDVVHVLEWVAKGPTLAGIETRFVRVRTTDECNVVILVPIGNFDGTMPYVGLKEWKAAVRASGGKQPVPVTWAYCLTAHLAQGSEFRRVTTFLPGDLSNPRFRKMTRLPSGETMPFSMRFLYTALSRAKVHTALIVS